MLLDTRKVEKEGEENNSSFLLVDHHDDEETDPYEDDSVSVPMRMEVAAGSEKDESVADENSKKEKEEDEDDAALKLKKAEALKILTNRARQERFKDKLPSRDFKIKIKKRKIIGTSEKETSTKHAKSESVEKGKVEIFDDDPMMTPEIQSEHRMGEDSTNFPPVANTESRDFHDNGDLKRGVNPEGNAVKYGEAPEKGFGDRTEKLKLLDAISRILVSSSQDDTKKEIEKKETGQIAEPSLDLSPMEIGPSSNCLQVMQEPTVDSSQNEGVCLPAVPSEEFEAINNAQDVQSEDGQDQEDQVKDRNVQDQNQDDEGQDTHDPDAQDQGVQNPDQDFEDQDVQDQDQNIQDQDVQDQDQDVQDQNVEDHTVLSSDAVESEGASIAFDKVAETAGDNDKDKQNKDNEDDKGNQNKDDKEGEKDMVGKDSKEEGEKADKDSNDKEDKVSFPVAHSQSTAECEVAEDINVKSDER